MHEKVCECFNACETREYKRAHQNSEDYPLAYCCAFATCCTILSAAQKILWKKNVIFMNTSNIVFLKFLLSKTLLRTVYIYTCIHKYSIVVAVLKWLIKIFFLLFYNKLIKLVFFVLFIFIGYNKCNHIFQRYY